jgi:hypothetical protein
MVTKKSLLVTLSDNKTQEKPEILFKNGLNSALIQVYTKNRIMSTTFFGLRPILCKLIMLTTTYCVVVWLCKPKLYHFAYLFFIKFMIK